MTSPKKGVYIARKYSLTDTRTSKLDRMALRLQHPATYPNNHVRMTNTPVFDSGSWSGSDWRVHSGGPGLATHPSSTLVGRSQESGGRPTRKAFTGGPPGRRRWAQQGSVAEQFKYSCDCGLDSLYRVPGSPIDLFDFFFLGLELVDRYQLTTLLFACDVHQPNQTMTASWICISERMTGLIGTCLLPQRERSGTCSLSCTSLTTCVWSGGTCAVLGIPTVRSYMLAVSATGDARSLLSRNAAGELAGIREKSRSESSPLRRGEIVGRVVVFTKR